MLTNNIQTEKQFTLAEIIEQFSHDIEQHEQRIIKQSVFAGLSATQIHYLDAVCHLENPTLSELAEKRKVSKPTATIAVEKLAQLGLVKKIRSDSDRRVSHLHLTKNGKKISDLHDAIHTGFAEKIQKKLTKSETASLITLLNKVFKE